MLTDERIEELILAGGGRWHDKSFWKIEDADLHPTARAIEAEVRKQDEALIRKLVEALDLGHSFGIECCNSFAERMNGRRQDQLTQLLAEAEQILNAAKAGRARLEGKP